MVGKAKALLLCMILLLMGGCANGPLFTVEVFETPTPDEATATPDPLLPDFSPTMSPVSVSTSLPEFTQAAAVIPADFSPILYGEKYDTNTFFHLLGGIQSGRWLTPEQAASYLKGTAEYDIYTSAGGVFQVLGYAPETTPVRPGAFTIGTDSTVDEQGMVGVAHGWSVRVGEVEELSPASEIYRQAVLDWLKTQGLDDPQMDSLHIYRIDLEGDGADEIFLSASHLDDSQHITKKGDYSIVLMRKVAGTEVVTQPLVSDIYRSQEAEAAYPSTYAIANFIDLNQDGILEVVVNFQRWEASGAVIYTISGQDITRIP